MIIERTYNVDHIKQVLTDPGIWECIGGEEGDQSSYEPKIDEIWLTSYNNGSPIGMFNVHKTDLGLYQCHVQVLPEYRRDALEFGSRVLDWVWEHTEINKLIALIPETFENVKNFAITQGFEIEGFLTNTHEQGGHLFGNWLLAIGRENGQDTRAYGS